MTILKLRPYQQECLYKIQERFNSGIKRQLIQIPTAGGKTVIFGHLIQKMKCRSLVIAHTNELIEQAEEKIKMICPNLDVGLVNSFRKEFDRPIVISSIQSARQPETLKQLQKQDFSLLIYDEAHHAASESARMVLDSLGFGKESNNLLVGFTATPMRSDGRGLGEDFDEIVFSKTIKNMIQENYLCFPKGIKITTDLDLSNIEIEKGDYKATSLSSLMDTDEINQLIAKTYMEKGRDRKAICFGVSVAHAENLSKWFRIYGAKAETISGDMPLNERKEVLKRFKAGEINVLTNCQVLTEGFDAPNIDCIIIARPTKSQSLYIQMVGRGMRLFPNKKDCLILDFGDKYHTLCGTNVLIGDVEEPKNLKCQKKNKITSLFLSLPPTINQKLRRTFLEFNPLGDEFIWQKDSVQGDYFLKGSGYKTLRIHSISEDRYQVTFFNAQQSQQIASGLSFEYAFAVAEDFAKANRSLFSVSDLDASWRNDPISDRQKKFFKSNGFKIGVEELTKGQAAIIISSGILRTKAVRR
jgi:ATP-dependent helicase IRC3